MIEITGATGTGPYDIYVCDITLTYCYLVSSATTIPPTYTVTIPIPLDGASQVIVKLIDSLSCETIQLYTCLTPTPTPTLTPTPTTTPIINCNCISFSNTSIAKQNFTYTQCNGTIFYGTIDPLTSLYVCGKLPSSNPEFVNITISSACIDGSCPPPTPTPTPTPTVTPTNTVTPTLTPTVTPTNTVTPTPTATAANVAVTYRTSNGGFTTSQSGTLSYTLNGGASITISSTLLSNHGTLYVGLVSIACNYGDVLVFNFVANTGGDSEWGQGNLGSYGNIGCFGVSYTYNVTTTGLSDLYFNLSSLDTIWGSVC